MNSVNLTGRLTTDPVRRETSRGVVVEFRLAVDTRPRIWLDIEVWGHTAGIAATPSTARGRQLHVSRHPPLLPRAATRRHRRSSTVRSHPGHRAGRVAAGRRRRAGPRMPGGRRSRRRPRHRPRVDSGLLCARVPRTLRDQLHYTITRAGGHATTAGVHADGDDVSLVTVDVDLTDGARDVYTIPGVDEPTVRQSRDRFRAAFATTGLNWPKSGPRRRTASTVFDRPELGCRRA
jgi:hypothetical protein